MNDDPRQPSGLIVSCLGDVAPVGGVEAYLEEVGPEAVADRLWEPVRGSDLIVMNLESPLRPESRAAGLFNNRTVVGLANNHIMDLGERGLIETIELLDAHGVPHAGAGRNLEAAQQPAIIKFPGLHVGILCAADPRFHAAGKETAGVLPGRPDLLRECIGRAVRNCDVVVVSLHVGIEFSSYPSSTQVNLANDCLDAGATLVLFHHAHCISGQVTDERGVVLFGTGKYLFPYDHYVGSHPLTRRLIRRAHRAAAWRVEIMGPQAAKVESVNPLWIGDDGFPEEPSREEAEHTLRLIQRLSVRTVSQLFPLWRALGLLDPVFLALNGRAYVELARRVGFKKMFSTALGGVRAHLGASSEGS